MNQLQNSFMTMDQIQGRYMNREAYKMPKEAVKELSFQQVLKTASDQVALNSGIIFSKHANDRLASRNISLNEDQINRLSQAVKKAEEKRIRESLVMMDNIAFIVNVNNKTVITAMDQDMNNNQVFTNIDGAVIV